MECFPIFGAQAQNDFNAGAVAHHFLNLDVIGFHSAPRLRSTQRCGRPGHSTAQQSCFDLPVGCYHGCASFIKKTWGLVIRHLAQ